MDISEFNIQEQEAENVNNFEVLPAGDYEAVITESELKTTQKGDGKYIALKIQIISGDHSDRVLFANLNVVNPNPVAERIGRAELAAASIATTGGMVTDTAEMHDKPFICRIKVDKKDPTRNEVKGFMAIKEQAAPAAAAAPKAAAAPTAAPTAAKPAAPATGKKPWQK